MPSRTFKAISAFSALLLLLASCYWQAGVPTGTISFSVSGRPGARYIDPYADTLRVYLMAGNDLVRIGPAEHPYWDELSLSYGTASADYTSPEIPAGIAYTVMVVVGETGGGESDLVPLNHGMADGITVTQGASTTVTLTLEPVPPINHTDLWGMDVTGVIYDPALPFAYASTESELYSSNDAHVGPYALTADVTDAVVNSISSGEIYDTYTGGPVSAAYLNTSTGILPYQSSGPGSLRSDFFQSAAPRNILRSGSLVNPAEVTERLPMYIRSAGMGGAVAPGAVPGEWFDVDFGEYQGGTRMHDMVFTNTYAYIATSAGAYRIPFSAMKQGATAAGVISESTPFDAGVSGLRIVSLLAMVDNAGSTGTYLYMGTRDGIYVGRLDEPSSEVFASPPVRIAGSKGVSARALKGFNTYDDQTFFAAINLIAAFTPMGVEIYYQNLENPATGAVTSIPFYAGLPSDLPGDLNQMAFYPFNGWAYLLVAGKKGLCSYEAYFFTNP